MSQINITTPSEHAAMTLSAATDPLAAAWPAVNEVAQEPVGDMVAPPAPAAPPTAQTDATPFDRRMEQVPIGQTDRRKSLVNRRLGLDRRVLDIGSPTGLERRRGPGRRRTDDRRSAEEGEMTDEQFEFMLAVDTYKRLNNRPFPSWTEVLEVVKQLGYRKVATSTITLSKATGRSV